MSDSGALYTQGENNDNRLGLAQDSWTSWFTYEPVEEGGQKVLKKNLLLCYDLHKRRDCKVHGIGTE